jgi:D-psicose/D-tagatose/L-ribulose 3-epimerase
MTMLERLALCNEVLAPWPFAQQCEYASRLGYRGLEVAPFTLADDPGTITDRQAAQWRAIAADHGLVICGLHWLLVAPRGLSITSPEKAVRDRTGAFIRRLIELCAQLGGSYLVHGSPAQRNPAPGQSSGDALALASEAWTKAGEHATALKLSYCIEPLSADQTQVVNTVAQAMKIVDAANVAGLKTMLDTSSAGLSEAEPLDRLIERWWAGGKLAHVQLNDRNRRGPGQGEDRFAPILTALRRQGYDGWLAMEPFDYLPDGPGCAAHSIGYVRGLLEAG